MKAHNGAYYIDLNIWKTYDKEIFDRLVHELGLELPEKEVTPDA